MRRCDADWLSGIGDLPKPSARISAKARRRQLKRLWGPAQAALNHAPLARGVADETRRGARQCRKAWRLVVVEMAAGGAAFGYRLDRRKLWRARSREGRYLLRTNLVEEDPAKLWKPLSAAGHDRSGLQEPQSLRTFPCASDR
jgi:hypothetical protein